MSPLSPKILPFALAFVLAACVPVEGPVAAEQQTQPTSAPSSAEISAPVKKSTFPRSSAIADAMSAAGIRCEEYAPTGAGNGAIDRAVCWIGRSDLILSIFPGPEGVRYELEGHREVNRLVSGSVDVAGSNWVVNAAGNLPLARSIAEELDGVLVDFDRIGEGPFPDLPK